MNNKDAISYSETELKYLAKYIAQTITVRGTEAQEEHTRKTTGWEENYIYEVAYGTLLAIRNMSYHPELLSGIMYTAESILDNFMPHCNGYTTLYMELNNLFIENKTETKLVVNEDYVEYLRNRSVSS